MQQTQELRPNESAKFGTPPPPANKMITSTIYNFAFE